MRISLRSPFVLILFASALLSAGTVGPTDRYLPLIQDGGGWTTEITVINVSPKPTRVGVSFLTAKGFLEPWTLKLKASTGTVSKNEVVADLAPGAVLQVVTDGSPSTLTRGFAEVLDLTAERPLGAYARLVKRVDDKVVQTFNIPYSPINERRSVLPLDFTQGAKAELVFVSLTNSPVLDLTIRGKEGEIVLTDQLTFDQGAQLFVNPLERWPALENFLGTLEWTVSFPLADRYESRTLGAIGLWTRDAGVIFAVPGMTLPADQDTSDPYN